MFHPTRRFVIAFMLFYCSSSYQAFAWGPEGHALVGRLALRFLKEDVKQNVLALLGPMSIDTATNWMDIMKSNQDYEFMRPWHYVNFPKGSRYIHTHEDNSINRLYWSYKELKNKKVYSEAQTRFNLYVVLHLMGDLHMPLHNGYAEDIGGNTRMVQYDTLKDHNLHWFWDEDIIRLTGITDTDCLKHYNQQYWDTLKTVDFEGWMYESRSYLPQVYDFPGFELDSNYLHKNKQLVEQQLMKAALRLAFVLNSVFASAAPEIDFKPILARYKNSIDVTDALNHVGKKVTICARVYSLRSTPTITQLSVAQPFPNNPLTVIIFGKNYDRFPQPPDRLYKDKNICVKGTIELYRGKPQIIVEDPEDITIL